MKLSQSSYSYLTQREAYLNVKKEDLGEKWYAFGLVSVKIQVGRLFLPSPGLCAKDLRKAEL